MAANTADNIDDLAVADAIRRAEQRTSGEIRVFVSRFRPGDATREARRQFAQLGMDRTPLRNAILLYFAPANGAFALVGDESVTFRTDDALAESVRAAMEPPWNQGDHHAAVLAAVEAAGIELSRHFPRSAIDRDDLSNQVLRD